MSDRNRVTGQYGSADSPGGDDAESTILVSVTQRVPTDSEIGALCRCLSCCCRPGLGHRHPGFDLWLVARLYADGGSIDGGG